MRLNVDYMELDGLFAKVQETLPDNEKLTRNEVKQFEAIFARIAEVSNNGWISVDERLPERGIMVLTAIFGTDVIMPMDGETPEDAMERCLHRPARASIGFVDEDGCWCGADGWPEVIQPKYWMEMPETPKEGWL